MRSPAQIGLGAHGLRPEELGDDAVLAARSNMTKRETFNAGLVAGGGGGGGGGGQQQLGLSMSGDNDGGTSSVTNAGTLASATELTNDARPHMSTYSKSSSGPHDVTICISSGLENKLEHGVEQEEEEGDDTAGSKWGASWTDQVIIRPQSLNL